MDLSPPFVARLLESVVETGANRTETEAVALPASRRIPLFRKASLERASADPAVVAEDCVKLVASRGGRMRLADGSPLEPERLVRLEAFLASREPSYGRGHFLSLVRLAQDLSDTAVTGVTAVERRSLHLLERRLAEMQRSERPANPAWTASWLSAVRSGDPLRQCALLDLMRYLDEVTGHPLVAFPEQAASDSIHLLLAIHHFSARTARTSRSALPLDVCLGARCILANTRVLHLRLGALLDQVLSPELPLWEKLEEWTRAVDHKNPAVFRLPAELLDPAFVVEGVRMEPIDLVLSAVERIDRSNRPHSVVESLVALERTLYRRIYRQEGRKHHMAVLLRRVLDRALHEKNRRNMRLTPSNGGAAQVLSSKAQGAGLPPWDESDWIRLRDRGEILENARDIGFTPTAWGAWRTLFGTVEPQGEELADLDEFLRWTLDCRGSLDKALESRTEIEVTCIREWFHALTARSVSAHPGPGSAKTAARRIQRDRTSPLMWFAAARRLGLQTDGPVAVVTQGVPVEELREMDGHVPAALENWRDRHPWDRKLFGIWPAELRGACFLDGIRPGLRRSRNDGTPAYEAEVRLEMLERELEYRSWLGARERVALLERTLEPA